MLFRSACPRRSGAKQTTGKNHTGAHGRHKEDGAGERARGGRGSPENARNGGGNGSTAAAIAAAWGRLRLGFLGGSEEGVVAYI